MTSHAEFVSSAGRRAGRLLGTGLAWLPTLAVVTLLLGHGLALAAPSGSIGGGSVFGATNQTFGQSIKNMLIYGRWIMFVMGLVFVGIGAFCLGNDMPFFKRYAGAAACFLTAGIGALINSLSQGEEVATPDLN